MSKLAVYYDTSFSRLIHKVDNPLCCHMQYTYYSPTNCLGFSIIPNVVLEVILRRLLLDSKSLILKSHRPSQITHSTWLFAICIQSTSSPLNLRLPDPRFPYKIPDYLIFYHNIKNNNADSSDNTN